MILFFLHKLIRNDQKCKVCLLCFEPFYINKIVGTFSDMHRGAHNFDVEIYLKDALNMS